MTSMDDTVDELLELSFRIRVKPNCKDAPLVRYLKKFSPSKRKDMILRALRLCFLVEAVKEDSELSRVDAKKLLASLERTFFDQSLNIGGEDFSASFHLFNEPSNGSKIDRAK